MIKKMKELKDIPSGNNWKVVLLEIIKNSPHSYSESHKMSFNDDNHPIAKKLKITGFELMLAISFLRENKLIKDNNALTPLNHPAINANWYNEVLLTEKGFDVGVKLENEISNYKVQKTLTFFTIIIGWTGIITLIKDLFPTRIKIVFLTYLLILVIMLISFFYKNLNKKKKRIIFKRKIKSGKYGL